MKTTKKSLKHRTLIRRQKCRDMDSSARILLANSQFNKFSQHSVFHQKNHTNLKQYITPSLAIYIHIYTMPVIGLIQSPNVASKGINLKTVVKCKQNTLYSLLEMFLVMGARRNLPKSHVYCQLIIIRPHAENTLSYCYRIQPRV